MRRFIQPIQPAKPNMTIAEKHCRNAGDSGQRDRNADSAPPPTATRLKTSSVAAAKVRPSNRNCAVTRPRSGTTKRGISARKNSITLGLQTFITIPRR